MHKLRYTMKNKIGDISNGLKILGFIAGKSGVHRKYKCKCLHCGKIYNVYSHNFKIGKGCFCKKHLYNNLVGKTIGKVNIIELIKRDKESGKRQGHLYICECTYCGRRHQYHSMVISRKGFLGCRCNTEDINHSAKKKVYQSYITNSKGRGIYFDISFEEVIKLCSGNCHYCGSEPSCVLKAVDILGVFKYNGIDRLDNTKGYIISNSVSCCKTCNWMKQKMTKDEFIIHIRKIFLKQNKKHSKK